ncbi:MAG: hypothetical protein D6791_02225 [Chloroflexi bacterium]|nr:MAG: hypothetical protein D6791_02225 [Chloroflexota bacterium]
MILAALVLGLLAGLIMSTPATAGGPDDTVQMIRPDTLAADPQVEYQAAAPTGQVPEPGSAGFLHVHVYDWLTRRPLGSRTISIYDRSGEQVAQATTTCQGYVEFDSLPGGAYRVLLEPDPDWTTARRSNFPGGRNSPGVWVWVRPYWRVGVRFYELPNVGSGGLRVYALDANSRQAGLFRVPLPDAAFTVYDASGNFVANGVTGCGGFVDFNNLGPGQYRVVDANEADAAYRYPLSGERWVSVQFGALTSTWFFTVASPSPESTPPPSP